jgi:hypothetical protein
MTVWAAAPVAVSATTAKPAATPRLAPRQVLLSFLNFSSMRRLCGGTMFVRLLSTVVGEASSTEPSLIAPAPNGRTTLTPDPQETPDPKKHRN